MSERTTARVAKDEATGREYLQGIESATKNTANVFGNGRIVLEAEVEHCFFVGAEDNFDDHAEVYRFRLWNWTLENGQANASVMIDWQDFTSEEYGWNRLLSRAVERISNARYNKTSFEPLTIGAPY